MSTTRTRRKLPAADPLLVPVSELKAEPVELLRHYPDGAGRQAAIEGDQHLLVRLSEERQRRQCYGRPWLTVGELPDELLRAVVLEVETLHYGSWQLAGAEIQSIVARLDAHFRPLQEAAAEERRKAGALAARRAALEADAIAQQPGWPHDAITNGKRDAELWGLPTA